MQSRKMLYGNFDTMHKNKHSTGHKTCLHFVTALITNKNIKYMNASLVKIDKKILYM